MSKLFTRYTVLKGVKDNYHVVFSGKDNCAAYNLDMHNQYKTKDFLRLQFANGIMKSDCIISIKYENKEKVLYIEDTENTRLHSERISSISLPVDLEKGICRWKKEKKLSEAEDQASFILKLLQDLRSENKILNKLKFHLDLQQEVTMLYNNIHNLD